MSSRSFRAQGRRGLATVIAVAFSFSMTAATAPALAAPQEVGVQAHLLWSNVDAAGVDRQLDLAQGAGASMVRVDVGWGSIETRAKGSYESWYLGKLDSTVAKAEAKGIKLLLTVFYTPCWASSAPETIKQGCSGAWWDRGAQRYPPTNPQDYADIMAMLAQRYGSRVAAWELWNEPNLPEFFESSTPAKTYATLVKTTYPRVKQANPNAIVVAGSLSNSDYAFTEALYREGIRGHFDAFSIHPYNGDRSPLDSLAGADATNSFLRGVPAVRNVMASHADSRPMWLTELGWNTSDVRGGAFWQNGVAELTQAQYLELAYEQIARWPFVAAAFWFKLQDTSVDSKDPVANYGLVRYDGSAKPSYAALRRASSAVVHQPYAGVVQSPAAGSSITESPAAGPPVTGAWLDAPRGGHAHGGRTSGPGSAGWRLFSSRCCRRRATARPARALLSNQHSGQASRRTCFLRRRQGAARP